MSEYYHICSAKIIGTEKLVLVKTEDGYVNAGNIVEFHIGRHRNLAEVVCVSFVSAGSDDESVMKSIAPVYEIEKIYREYWKKEEEEKKDD